MLVTMENWCSCETRDVLCCSSNKLARTRRAMRSPATRNQASRSRPHPVKAKHARVSARDTFSWFLELVSHDMEQRTMDPTGHLETGPRVAVVQRMTVVDLGCFAVVALLYVGTKAKTKEHFGPRTRTRHPKQQGKRLTSLKTPVRDKPRTHAAVERKR